MRKRTKKSQSPKSIKKQTKINTTKKKIRKLSEKSSYNDPNYPKSKEKENLESKNKEKQ